jgi:hypothetical protein
MKKILSILTIILLLSCTNSTDTIEYQREIMVFGFLWGNHFLTRDHGIWISYSQPLTTEYDPDSAGISNAAVTLTDSLTQLQYNLMEDSTRKGFYYNNQLLIQPEHTYFIEIRVGDRTVRAKTTVPPELTIITNLEEGRVNNVYPDIVSVQYPILINSKNPEQVVMVDLYCNEPYYRAEYIDPLGPDKYPSSQTEYDGGNDGPPRHIYAVAQLKDFSQDVNSKMYLIDWYSSMIVFYGSYTMQVLAIDENYTNYLFSEYPVYSGGIEGGLGVFASVTGKKYHLNVMKR